MSTARKLLAFDVAVRKGRRTTTWQRFALDIATARESATLVAEHEGYRVVSVTESKEDPRT